MHEVSHFFPNVKISSGAHLKFQLHLVVFISYHVLMLMWKTSDGGWDSIHYGIIIINATLGESRFWHLVIIIHFINNK